jgi:hypothetical protein
MKIIYQPTEATLIATGKETEIQIKMDDRTRVLDNNMVKRLWHSVKYQKIGLKQYTAVEVL